MKIYYRKANDMSQTKRHHASAMTTFILLLVAGTATVAYLKNDTATTPTQETTVVTETTIASTSVVDFPLETASDTTSESEFHNAPLVAENSELVHNLSQAEVSQLLADIQTPNYTQDLIASQNAIMDSINKNKQNPAELGYLFLPKQPAELNQLQQAKQLDVPLLLQKDPKWRSLKYGSDTTQELGENGCAILSLSMVHAYYENKNVSPMDILKWSQDRYYLHNQGTSWMIFYDFAQEFGYRYMNYGDNFIAAMQAVNNGEVVVASVDPGKFTEFGHILIIRGYDNGYVYVNDPNDDPSKMFSIQPIPESVFWNEGTNYWSLSK